MFLSLHCSSKFLFPENHLQVECLIALPWLVHILVLSAQSNMEEGTDCIDVKQCTVHDHCFIVRVLKLTFSYTLHEVR